MTAKDKKTDSLKRQRDLVAAFEQWFGVGLAGTIEDNRRRYRMEIADAAERAEVGLSAIPSTKSVSVVDGIVLDALMEYHGEPDVLGYVAKNTADLAQEEAARLLSALVTYRMEHTFPFVPWHTQSIKAGTVDGMEAALVWWRREAYTEKRTVYASLAGGVPEEISEEMHDLAAALNPDQVITETIEEEVVVADSWWIDQLSPGETLFWDFKNPVLDLNSGEWCVVVVAKSAAQLAEMAESGLLDRMDAAEADAVVRDYRESSSSAADTAESGRDKDIETEGHDRATVWLAFTKKSGRWMFEVSARGEKALSSERPANEVFFNGRRINRLPVVLGAQDLALWQAVGRGVPEVMAPVDDEIANAKNNAADYAKQVIQGRWRMRPGADLDLDSLLNSRVFAAEAGDVEQVPPPGGFMESLRVQDSLTAELHELVPAGIESRSLVPKGTSKTLGASQIQMQAADRRLNGRIVLRNETFLKPLLYIIGQMELAWESDQQVIRLAGARGKVDNGKILAAGMKLLDLEFDVKINAGFGTTPRALKASKIIEISEWRKAHGVPTDFGAVAKQLNILAGFQPEQFDPAEPPAPPAPEVEYKANVSIDLATLPQDAQAAILQVFISGKGSITAAIKEDEQAAKERTRALMGAGIGPQTQSMERTDYDNGSGAAGGAGVAGFSGNPADFGQAP